MPSVSVPNLLRRKFLEPQLWVPFFASVGASVGCFINVQAKKKALVARAKAQAARDAELSDKREK